MKRIICLSLAACMLLCLTACAEPPALNREPELGFSVTRDGADWQGTLSLHDGALSIVLTAPYTVAGMRFDYTDEGLCIRRGALGTKANCDYIPSDAVPQELHNALSYLGEAVYSAGDDVEDRYILSTPRGDALLTAREGVPTSLTTPESGSMFTFFEIPYR